MKPIIYVSGKYTDSSKDKIERHIAKAREESIKIWEAGGIALCPHLNTMHFEEDCKCTYNDYLEGDIRLLEGCDGIYMVEGWKDSEGAKIELKEAKKLGMYVFYTIEEIKAFIKKLPKQKCDISNKYRKTLMVNECNGNVFNIDPLIYSNVMKFAGDFAQHRLNFYRKGFILLPK